MSLRCRFCGVGAYLTVGRRRPFAASIVASFERVWELEELPHRDALAGHHRVVGGVHEDGEAHVPRSGEVKDDTVATTESLLKRKGKARGQPQLLSGLSSVLPRPV